MDVASPGWTRSVRRWPADSQRRGRYPGAQRALRSRGGCAGCAGRPHRRGRSPEVLRFPPAMLTRAAGAQRLPQELSAAAGHHPLLLRQRRGASRDAALRGRGQGMDGAADAHRSVADAGCLLPAVSRSSPRAACCRRRAASTTCTPGASATNRRPIRPACSVSACASSCAWAATSRCWNFARHGWTGRRIS